MRRVLNDPREKGSSSNKPRRSRGQRPDHAAWRLAGGAYGCCSAKSQL